MFGTYHVSQAALWSSYARRFFRVLIDRCIYHISVYRNEVSYS